MVICHTELAAVIAAVVVTMPQKSALLIAVEVAPRDGDIIGAIGDADQLIAGVG